MFAMGLRVAMAAAVPAEAVEAGAYPNLATCEASETPQDNWSSIPTTKIYQIKSSICSKCSRNRQAMFIIRNLSHMTGFSDTFFVGTYFFKATPIYYQLYRVYTSI